MELISIVTFIYFVAFASEFDFQTHLQNNKRKINSIELSSPIEVGDLHMTFRS